VTGTHNLQEETNDGLICEYAAGNNMIIVNTKSQLKKIRKGTRISPNGQMLVQIDHVLANQKKK
jgi:hypothetical protein